MVVVQMNLDITEPAPAKARQLVQMAGMIFFRRKEERMLRWTSVRVVMARGDLRISFVPSAHTFNLFLQRNPAQSGLKMICQTDVQIYWAGWNLFRPPLLE